MFQQRETPLLNINTPPPPPSVSDLKLHNQLSLHVTESLFWPHTMRNIPYATVKKLHIFTSNQQHKSSPEWTNTHLADWSDVKHVCTCILCALRLLLSCTICKTLFPNQLFVVIWHHSNLIYTSVLCLKSSKSILATHWNNFTGGVWLYFQAPLDWLALVPLACVRCFAATLAPPPSSGPHLHQSTRLAACTLTHSCYKLCELTILASFGFKPFLILAQKFRFSFVHLFTASCQICS